MVVVRPPALLNWRPATVGYDRNGGAAGRKHRLRPGNSSRPRPLNGYGSRVGGHLGNGARLCRIDRQLRTLAFCSATRSVTR